MKFRITIDVPTAEEIARGLDPHNAHAGLAPAELHERQRAQDLEEVRAALQTAQARAERVAADVQAGRAAMRDLDTAMRDRDALALRITPAEAALEAATRSREQGHAHALGALSEEGRRRNAMLQELADQLAPALLAIRETERHLEQSIAAALGLGISGSTGLPSVVWPGSLRDDLAARRWPL